MEGGRYQAGNVLSFYTYNESPAEFVLPCISPLLRVPPCRASQRCQVPSSLGVDDKESCLVEHYSKANESGASECTAPEVLQDWLKLGASPAC